MNRGLLKSADRRAWKELYRAALLEGDRGRIPQLIAEAERAIVVRARELFNTAGDNAEEQEALDDALYALQALRSTGQPTPPLPPLGRVASQYPRPTLFSNTL